jgi:hypothetical protein
MDAPHGGAELLRQNGTLVSRLTFRAWPGFNVGMVISMGERNYEVFVVRYIGDITDGKFMDIAVCISEMGVGNSRFLGCELTEEWEELQTLFPDADVELLQQWCAGIRKEFCSSDRNHIVREALKDCSNNIEVSLSHLTLAPEDDPRTEMRKLLRTHSR